MWSTAQYRQLVRASGWYDLIVTAAFVTPWSFLALHGLMQQWSQAFNLPGDLPPFAPMHLLMVNLMGSIVCVWSVLRIRDPQLAFRTLRRRRPAAVLHLADLRPGPRWHGLDRRDPVFRTGLGGGAVVAGSRGAAGDSWPGLKHGRTAGSRGGRSRQLGEGVAANAGDEQGRP